MISQHAPPPLGGERRSRPIFVFVLIACLLAEYPPLSARTRKGDKFLAEGRAAEVRKDWDKALDFDEKALSEDPTDAAYQLETRRVRFESSTFHVKNGQKIRAQGKLTEALLEFQKAYETDPSLDVAEQEVQRTRAMIERERKKAAQPKTPGDGQAAAETPEDRGLTPHQLARKEENEKFESMLPVPELRPLNPQPINLKMNNQKPKILFETVGKLAGINVLFDPEYDSTPGKNQSIEFNGSTLDQALDYLAVVTKSFWKPLSSNTIFVTVDNPTKRREYSEQVVKIFYLTNVTSPQELQEIITALRTAVAIQKIFQFTSQNALIIRAETDQMALAEKIIADLDKPRSEVVVDVMVMEVSRTHTRNLAAAFASGGINSSIIFTPRNSILGPVNASTSNNNTTNTNGNNSFNGGTNSFNGSTSNAVVPSLGATSGGTGTSTAGSPILLPNLKRISTGDYSLTNVPGAFLEALLKDSGTRVLQAPQVRAVDNQKGIIKLGDKVPTATGSFGGFGGVGNVGISSLPTTSFTFLDVGVNLEITPHVHDANEVSLHLDIDISQVKDHIDLGGISQPIIGQRRLTLDIRMKDGEVNVLGGLIQQQDSKTTTGLPGLANIPILGRLFSQEQIEKDQSELLITLIPHIVRSPDITELNLRGVAAGNETNIKLNYAPRKQEPSAAPVAPTKRPPASAPLATAPPTPAPDGSARVFFAQPQIDAQLSSAITATLQVEGVTDLASLQAQLKFDPRILRINSVTSGDLLQHDGPALEPSKNILNDSGDATVSLTRAPGKPGVAGSGALINIVFQAVGKGTTTVAIPQLTLKNSAGQTIATPTPVLTVNVK
ncbi:MAG: cohesin domain-containing protein [Acidobacteriota bacterium]|nr:cohesin domain-containing protein [Acidobacteriota bacterium]